MKNCVIITPEFSPHTNWGGVATFCSELAKLLESMGCNVHIISYHPKNKFVIKKISDHITHHIIGLKTPSKVVNFLYYKIFSPIFKNIFFKFPSIFFIFEWNIAVYFYFRKLNKKINFEVIHTPSYHSPAFLISYLYSKIPLINHIQGPEEEINEYFPTSINSKCKALIENFYVKNMSDAVITCNQELEVKYAGIKSLNGKVHYIKNFIHINHDPSVPYDFLKISNFRTNILFWGRLEHRKGVDELLIAFINLKKSYPNLKLWLIGQDTNFLKYKNSFYSFEDFLDEILFPKSIRDAIFHIPRIDSPLVLKSLLTELSGICVFPSLHEPFGFVYLEAMSLGLITIGSMTGEAKNIIQNATDGFLVQPNSEEIETCIKKIYALPDNRIKKISRNAVKKISKKYSADSVVESYRQLHKKISL